MSSNTFAAINTIIVVYPLFVKPFDNDKLINELRAQVPRVLSLYIVLFKIFECPFSLCSFPSNVMR